MVSLDGDVPGGWRELAPAASLQSLTLHLCSTGEGIIEISSFNWHLIPWEHKYIGQFLVVSSSFSFLCVNLNGCEDGKQMNIQALLCSYVGFG